jgi:hypothetical protein
MNKPNPSMQSTAFCGIGVGAATLATVAKYE